MSQKIPTKKRSGVIWYDKEGKPFPSYVLGSKKWLEQTNKIEKLLTDRKYKVVKQETVGKYWVSTVWLGIDHSFNWFKDEPNPKPLIFETMVFKVINGKKDYSGEEQVRYVTEEQAKAGHKKMVKKYKEVK